MTLKVRPTIPTAGRLGVVVVMALVVIAVIAASFSWGLRLSESTATARAERLRTSQVAACERGNVVRWEINARGDILREFLLTAAEARSATAANNADDPVQAHIELSTAMRWTEMAEQIGDVDIPDCEEIIPPVGT